MSVHQSVGLSIGNDGTVSVEMRIFILPVCFGWIVRSCPPVRDDMVNPRLFLTELFLSLHAS